MARQFPTSLVTGASVTVAGLVLLYLFTRLPAGRETAALQSVGSTPAARPEASLGADKCATCHLRASPDIVHQFAASRMASSGVTCEDCHVVPSGTPGGHEHEGFFITSAPTPGRCQRCHVRESDEYAHSRHAGPAWMALSGWDDFTPAQRQQTEQIAELTRGPNGIPTATRNALFDIEGPNITHAACERCHAIGKPNADGSIGNCNLCHLRHEFSLAQARKPETCGQCHLGPDHPQDEIYRESAHGVLYYTQGARWNFEQRPGRLTTTDMPAPTCATCHLSGFGAQGTTHEVGTRLSQFLFAAISAERPNAAANRHAMQQVCANCHSQPFITAAYQRADSVTVWVNARVKEASALMDSLVKEGAIPARAFATPISFDAFNLWHYDGRTAKFAAYMQGPDYAQWHGAYPLLQELTKVKAEAAELRARRRGARP